MFEDSCAYVVDVLLIRAQTAEYAEAGNLEYGQLKFKVNDFARKLC